MNLGIWYYVYLKPTWVLRVFPRKIGSPNLPHMKAWTLMVVEEIARHYHLSEEQKKELADLPWCMPRGRVDDVDLDTGKPLNGDFAVYHGNDFPVGTKDGEIKRIIGRLNLSPLVFQYRVLLVEHKHEKMDEEHKKKAQAILGPIPY